jgi:hypothetical protein
MVMSWEGETHAARERAIVVPLPLPQAPSPPNVVDAWVVFGSARVPSLASLALLRARASQQPAAALVFDSRDHDAVNADCLELLCDAAQPRAVWWVGDDEWVRRLGGVAAEAVDPSDGIDVDHRHLRALAAGAAVLASADTVRGLWSQLLVAEPHPSGWKRLTLRTDIESFADDRAWAAAAFAKRAP